MVQFMEFLFLRGRRIRIHHQNVSGTNFAGTGTHFCTKFGNNSITVGRTVSGSSPSCSSSNFTYKEGKLKKIFEILQFSRMTLPSKRIFKGQFMEFVRFKRKGGLQGLRGRRIRIHHQILGRTIFAGTGLHFYAQFVDNSGGRGADAGARASPSCSSSNFAYGEGKLATILKTCQLSKWPVL